MLTCYDMLLRIFRKAEFLQVASRRRPSFATDLAGRRAHLQVLEGIVPPTASAQAHDARRTPSIVRLQPSCGVVGVALAFIVCASAADAQSGSEFVGRWQNGSGQKLEFDASGQVLIVGTGSAAYRTCGQNGSDLCVAFGKFQCRYRATYSEDNQTLHLAIGRPTKNCPAGLFRRIRASGGQDVR